MDEDLGVHYAIRTPFSFLKNKSPPFYQGIPCSRPKAHVALPMGGSRVRVRAEERVSQGPFKRQPPTTQGTADWQAEVMGAPCCDVLFLL